MEVLSFANAAARTSTLPAPKIGQPVFMLDTGDFLVYYGRAIGYRPPWGASWGHVAHGEITDFTGPFTDNNYGTPMGLEATFTPVKNRAYVVELEGVMYSPGVSELEFTVRNSYGSDNEATWARGWNLNPGDGLPFRISRRYVEGAIPIIGNRSVTFSAFYLSLIITGVGAGTEPKAPTRLTILDVGPSGNAPLG